MAVGAGAATGTATGAAFAAAVGAGSGAGIATAAPTRHKNEKVNCMIFVYETSVMRATGKERNWSGSST
jgi:hypothetical protein